MARLLLGGLLLAAILPGTEGAQASTPEEQLVQKISELNQALIAEKMRAAAAERRAVAAEARVKKAEEALQAEQAVAAQERKRAQDLAARVQDLEARLKELEAKAAAPGPVPGAGGALGTGTAPAPPTAPAPAAPLGPAGSAPAVAGPEVRFFTFPARKASALGLTVAGETKLAGAVPGAKQVRLVPPDAGDRRMVAMDAAPGLDLVKFLCEHPQKGKTFVATLTVKGEALFWAWKDFSPTGMEEALKQVENLMGTSIVELLGDGKVLARYQTAPPDVDVRVGRGTPQAVRLPKLLPDGTRFESDRAGDGWTIEAPDADTVRFTFADQAFTAALNRQAGTVQALWQVVLAAGDDDELRQMQDDLHQYEADLATLKKGSGTPATPAAAPPRLPRRVGVPTVTDPDDPTSKEKLIKTHIESLKKEIAEHLKKRAPPPPKAPPDVTKCGARVALPNGVILIRIKFKP